MDNFFKKNPTVNEYHERADVDCNRYASTLSVIFTIYLLITLTVSIINSTSDTILINGVKHELAWFSLCFNIIFGGMFTYSFAEISRKVHYREELVTLDLFYGLKKFLRAFCLNLLGCIKVFLWTLLFVVPGIMKSYAYVMAVYISNENPDLSANECLKRSEKMMDGLKWEYFSLMFRYIGWILLSVLTFGILFVWVLPKMKQTSYLFYLKISGKGEQDNLIKPTDVVREEY